MITRTAIFEGRVRDGREEEFFAAVQTRLAPLWQAFPGALAVRWWRAEACDDAERPVALIQQVDYPDAEVMAAALASPQRDAARAATLELLQMFDGRFYHVISGPDRLAGQQGD